MDKESRNIKTEDGWKNLRGSPVCRIKGHRRKMHISPHTFLVGYTGKIRCDNRLMPLHMTQKYKSFLEQQESERNEKIWQMEQLIKKYENIPSVINSLKKENKNNENSSLLLELEEEKMKSKRRLLYLESKLDELPDSVYMSMQKIFDQRSEFENCKKNCRPLKRMKSGFHKAAFGNKKQLKTGQTCEQFMPKLSPEETSWKKFDFTRQSTRSWFGSVKSQLLVRDVYSKLHTISIDLFSNGENLLQVLVSELGEDVKGYNVMFGTKKVDTEKSLWEQGIFHGSTVDLTVELRGGMESKETKRKGSEDKRTGNTGKPESWTKLQVRNWIETICEDYEIEKDDVSKLMSMNGKGLNKLREKDWIRRSPEQGEVLFLMWNDLKEEWSDNQTNKKEETKTDHLEEKRPTLVAATEEKASVRKDPPSACEEGANIEFEMSGSREKGLFGKVSDLKDMGDSISLYDLVNDNTHAIPKPGRIIAINGICGGEPQYGDGFGTILLRDDPPGAVSVFNHLKVDIRGRNGNKDLRPHAVEKLLKKIRSGISVGVRGRVEKLDQRKVPIDPAYETSTFKLIVDSDFHALVYMESSSAPLSRQLSQPRYVQQGIYSFVMDGKSLRVEDIIENRPMRIFCKSTVSDNEIKRLVVAFKNSGDGDILVGVEENGKVTGMEFTQGELLKWREKITMIIGQILPKSNEEISICATDEEARKSVGKKCFISVMKLGDSAVGEVEIVSVVTRIHVTKGAAPVYFSKPTDIHAFVRVGAENKRFSDYADLFSRLDSLCSRTVTPIADDESYVEQQCNKAVEEMEGKEKYRVFKTISFETQEREFKMIFGDRPVDTIEKKYLAQYSCGFLNSMGGNIFFGVQEDEQSKLGHVIGIVIPRKEREELVRKSVTILSNFYPPVNTSQFHVTFYDVSLPPALTLKYHETRVARSGKCVLLRGPPEEIGKKWPKFIKDKLRGTLSRVIRVKSKCFCIVAETQNSNSEEFTEIVEQFEKENSNVKLDDMDINELKPVLKDLCVVELRVNRSPYPIHMTKAIETFVFDKDGKLNELSTEKLMYRFGLDSRSGFDVEKFLKHVENFEPSGNSYILIASPFGLPKTERDLYGLVIPKWTLTIDLDQHPKQEGHLYAIFEDLNDLHQTERNRYVKTPQDQKLDLNPEHGICWLAARGYVEIDKSLSEEGHGSWNMTHRDLLRSLLRAELTSCVKPNRLNLVVLWDEEHRPLVDSLRTILEDILSINGPRIAVTFVCSTPGAQSDINNQLVKPLQENYWKIIEEDRVYVAPPHVLAQFLSCKLPAPYRPEDHYQVPHKKYYRQTSQILPNTLPKRLRQNIHGHLKMMYMTKERKPDEALLNKERKQFYSGSEITQEGLRGEIGIKRSKMADLEKMFNIFSHDKKSHVSLIFVKADRGAGTTTMCKQFLFKYHEKFPCAQLVEIRDGLASNIEDINKATKLPLLLLVDEEVAHLQDFLDFKKEVECRNINVIFLIIEPAEVFSQKQPTTPRKGIKSRMKSARDSSLYGTSRYKVVELRRELEPKEMEELTNELIAVDEGKGAKLTKLMQKAKHEQTLRTFAHFSLTAFGNEFQGLNKYVKFRLGLADEKQKLVLAFLSLTHVFTDYLFPASAFAGFLGTEKVSLEDELGNSYLRELLNPLTDENDSRRISFLEVAQEILRQLAAAFSGAVHQDRYWEYIKHVSVKMAKEVLSVNIGTKKIDRLARKLFVTSEYESEKFSLLIRSMKEDYPDIARDTLIDLVEVFQRHTSFRAHLLAHLAKYHMTVYKNFEEAKPLIKEAIKGQEEDVLLHHIQGDIIRLHVHSLKNNKDFEMSTIVSQAIESSECFEIVRNKRPRMSHGYVSDAMVRITVMQAAIKKMGGEKDISFVDYLIKMIDELKKKDDEISTNERYLLSLIPDAHQYLEEGVIDFEHKELWKEHFLKCIGDLANLNRLCEKLKDEKNSFSSSSAWLHKITVETQILNYALEIETKDLSQEELESRIKGIEECGSSSMFGERSMKFWIRYSRKLKSVPQLEAVNKRIKQWVDKTKKRGGISPHAEFYNYVVKVLIALKDPKDREKMSEAEKQIKRQQSKKYNKKEDVILPLEWLHTKHGHHINSIDSLLSHDDLVKETTRSSGRRDGKRRPGREVIEGSLFEQQVTKWEGTVKEIKNDRQGIIVFKGHLDVRFVPQNVQPSMPTTGDTVRFCLSFDRYGLSAWTVVRAAEYNQPKSLSEIVSSDEDSSEDDEVQKDSDDETVVPPSLFSLDVSEERDKTWDSYKGERMQGIVVNINSDEGYGFLKHPDVSGNLFFHASQLVNPVKSLEGTISKHMTLEFKVEKLTERIRAADIHVLKTEDISPPLQEYLASLQEEQRSSSSSSRGEKESHIPVKTEAIQGREEGVITKLCSNDTYGFIKPDKNSYGKDTIFFHRSYLVNKGSVLRIGDRVQFRVSKTKKGLEANDIFVQSQYSSNKKWEYFVGRGIQEGSVSRTTKEGGFINSSTVTGQKNDLRFYHEDILNASFAVVGAKVHFEVERRGGRCIAVRINVIGNSQPLLQTNPRLSVPSTSSAGFPPNYSAISFPHTFVFTRPMESFGNQFDDGDQMDKLP